MCQVAASVARAKAVVARSREERAEREARFEKENRETQQRVRAVTAPVAMLTAGVYGYFGWKQNATASAELAARVRGSLEKQAGALSTALRDDTAKRDGDASAATAASAAASRATSAAAPPTKTASARESTAAAPSGVGKTQATPASKKARGGLYNKFQDRSPLTGSAGSASPPTLAEDDAANERRVSRRRTGALSLLLCVAALGVLRTWLTPAQLAAGVAMAHKGLAALAQGVAVVTGAARAGLSAVARAILGAVGLAWSPS